MSWPAGQLGAFFERAARSKVPLSAVKEGSDRDYPELWIYSVREFLKSMSKEDRALFRVDYGKTKNPVFNGPEFVDEIWIRGVRGAEVVEGAGEPLGREVRTKSDAEAYAESMIAETSDPMWSLAARKVLSSLICELQREHGSRWGFDELAQLIPDLSTPDGAEKMVGLMPDVTNPKVVAGVHMVLAIGFK